MPTSTIEVDPDEEVTNSFVVASIVSVNAGLIVSLETLDPDRVSISSITVPVTILEVSIVEAP